MELPTKEEVVSDLKRLYGKASLDVFCHGFGAEINEAYDTIIFANGISDVNWKKGWDMNYTLTIRILYLAFPEHHSEIISKLNSNSSSMPSDCICWNFGWPLRDL